MTESAGSVTVVVSVLEGGVGTPVLVALTTVNISADGECTESCQRVCHSSSNVNNYTQY